MQPRPPLLLEPGGDPHGAHCLARDVGPEPVAPAPRDNPSRMFLWGVRWGGDRIEAAETRPSPLPEEHSGSGMDFSRVGTFGDLRMCELRTAEERPT